MPVFDFNGTSYPENKPIWDVDTAVHETKNIWEGSNGVNNLVYTASVPIAGLNIVPGQGGAEGSLTWSHGVDNGDSNYNIFILKFPTTIGHQYYFRCTGWRYGEYNYMNDWVYLWPWKIGGSEAAWNERKMPSYWGIPGTGQIGAWNMGDASLMKGWQVGVDCWPGDYPAGDNANANFRRHVLFTATSSATVLFNWHRGSCPVGYSTGFRGAVKMICDVTELHPTSADDCWAKLGYTEFTGTKEIAT